MIQPQTVADAAREHLATTLLEVGRGNQVAFRELHLLTSEKLMRECLRVCQNHQAAEEVLHEVYLIIWQRANRWQPGRASPISWLATIARNRSIDWLRTVRRDAAEPPSVQADPRCMRPDAEAASIAACEIKRMLGHLNRLDLNQRDAIRTAFLDEMTSAEIAKRKGVPIGTVKSWSRRGLARLKRELQSEERDALPSA